MESLITNPVFGVISFIGAVIFLFLYFYNPKIRERQGDYERFNEAFIKRLEESEARWKNLYEALAEKFDRISKEHEVIKNILQGRDADAIKFRDKGFECYEQVKNINDLGVKTYAKTMEIVNLVKNIK